MIQRLQGSILFLLLFSCSSQEKPEKPGTAEKSNPDLRRCTIATVVTSQDLGRVQFDNPDTVRILLLSHGDQTAMTINDTFRIKPLDLNEHICIFKNVMEVTFSVPVNEAPAELKCLPLLSTINLNLFGPEDLRSLGQSLSAIPQLRTVVIRSARKEQLVTRLKKYLRKDLAVLR